MHGETKTLKEIAKNLWQTNIIPVNPNDDKDRQLIDDLKKATVATLADIKRQPIYKRRPNEVGNAIEPYIENAINRLDGYKAQRPTNKQGKAQSSGYPDLLVRDSTGRYSYVECKTYNKESIDSSLRAFYLSPPKKKSHAKVIHDARHIVISLHINKRRNGGYIAKGFKILDICNLRCTLKEEWNAHNKELFRHPLLATG